MDRFLVLLTRPLLTTIRLVDEMLAASSIEAAATACAEIERRKALRMAVAELDRPRLTTGAA